MGCTSLETHGTRMLITSQKPGVWLIGGGPGSNKGIVCDQIIRDYKFKYLSSYDMIRFEQERGGPDAEMIQKLFDQDKTLPSPLVVRLVKKAIASCGIRRFIIDGFPSTVQDIAQFSRQLTPSEIDFYGYIQVKISAAKMKESGLRAHEKSKENQQQIDTKISETVNKYLAESDKIRTEYQKMGKFIQIDGEKGADDAYHQLRNYFNLHRIQPPKPIQVFFSRFDNPQYQAILCDDLVRKYGLYFYTAVGLIDEARFKNNSQEATQILKLEKQNKNISPQLVLSLIRKKIAKHDYQGSFLLSGYPRSIDDAKQWDREFGWETDIKGFISFEISAQVFKTQFQAQQKKSGNDKVEQQYKKYMENYQQVTKYYEDKQLYLKVNAEDEKKSLEDIHQFFLSKDFHCRPKISNSNLVFVSTLSGDGEIPAQCVSKAHVINFDQVIESAINSNGLYSELIASFLKIGKPIPGIIATRLLLAAILSTPTSHQCLIIRSFPNSAEQLQSWQQQVGQSINLSAIIYYQFNAQHIEKSIKTRIQSSEISGKYQDVVEGFKRYGKQLENKVTHSDWKYMMVNEGIKKDEIADFLTKMGFDQP